MAIIWWSNAKAICQSPEASQLLMTSASDISNGEFFFTTYQVEGASKKSGTDLNLSHACCLLFLMMSSGRVFLWGLVRFSFWKTWNKPSKYLSTCGWTPKNADDSNIGCVLRLHPVPWWWPKRYTLHSRVRGKNTDFLLWIWARFLVAKQQSVIDNWRWSTISHQHKIHEFS